MQYIVYDCYNGGEYNLASDCKEEVKSITILPDERERYKRSFTRLTNEVFTNKAKKRRTGPVKSSSLLTDLQNLRALPS